MYGTIIMRLTTVHPVSQYAPQSLNLYKNSPNNPIFKDPKMNSSQALGRRSQSKIVTKLSDNYTNSLINQNKTNEKAPPTPPESEDSPSDPEGDQDTPDPSDDPEGGQYRPDLMSPTDSFHSGGSNYNDYDHIMENGVQNRFDDMNPPELTQGLVHQDIVAPFHPPARSETLSNRSSRTMNPAAVPLPPSTAGSNTGNMYPTLDTSSSANNNNLYPPVSPLSQGWDAVQPNPYDPRTEGRLLSFATRTHYGLIPALRYHEPEIHGTPTVIPSTQEMGTNTAILDIQPEDLDAILGNSGSFTRMMTGLRNEHEQNLADRVALTNEVQRLEQVVASGTTAALNNTFRAFLRVMNIDVREDIVLTEQHMLEILHAVGAQLPQANDIRDLARHLQTRIIQVETRGTQTRARPPPIRTTGLRTTSTGTSPIHITPNRSRGRTGGRVRAQVDAIEGRPGRAAAERANRRIGINAATLRRTNRDGTIDSGRSSSSGGHSR